MDYGGGTGKPIGTRDIEEVHRRQFDIYHVVPRIKCQQYEANDILCPLRFVPYDGDDESRSLSVDS